MPGRLVCFEVVGNEITKAIPPKITFSTYCSHSKAFHGIRKILNSVLSTTEPNKKRVQYLYATLR
jgi:hypothetical protein